MTLPPIDVFLSYSFRDSDAVQVVARALQQDGISVFLDRWYLLPGLPWPDALETALGKCRAVAVFLGPGGLGSWQQQEKNFALNRQRRSPTFPVIPVLLPGADPGLSFLTLNTWIDLREGIQNPPELERLVAAVGGTVSGPDLQAQLRSAASTVCPYRGLRPFREEDADFFFGREMYIPVMLDAVNRSSFVAVVGGSGSGKSSLVRAGLVPKLRQEGETTFWDAITLVPGDRPHHALTDALLPLIGEESTGAERLVKVSELATLLVERKVTLTDLVREALRRQTGTERILVVVDQWEELYPNVEDAERTRHLFIDELLIATKNSKLSVVITVRGDFFGAVLNYRALADRLQNSVVSVGPMNRSELRRTIVEPARLVHLDFEPGLVERTLNDVEDEPGNLPLLEFALTELWGRRKNGLLLNDAYDDLGGVAGAIAQRAEAEFAKFTKPEQVVASNIFASLVRVARPDEGVKDSRQRVILDELQSDQNSKNVKDVIRVLADARLLVTSRDAATGKMTVEVAHEALIRKWDRLRDWVDEDRDGLRLHDRLRNATKEWRAQQQRNSFLYHGGQLAEALQWKQRNETKLSPDEKRFLQKSNALRRALRSVAVAVTCIIVLTAFVAVVLALRERQLKIEIMRGSDELKMASLVEELRGLWLDEKGMQDWLSRAEDFSTPVDRHAGINDALDRRLRQFRFDATGEMANVKACLERLRKLKQKTIEEQSDKWNEVIKDVADPRSTYNGLQLKPIEGLVPLGKDPNTRLEEFAVYLTGDGPVRGNDGNLIIEPGSAMVLVLLPSGTFDMGTDSREQIEKPVMKNLGLQAFLLSKFEMTQGQWLRTTYSNPSQFKTEAGVGTVKPVETISWEEAREVLRRLHLVLPTEAQWEYAAKAGSSGDWFTGDSEQTAAASCISQSHETGAPKEPRQATCDVTYGQPNRFGLFGVIGNVWEWCLDPLCPYNVPPNSGTGERECARIQRVFRGGSFYSEPNNARMTLRRSNPPEFKSSNVGVRPGMRLN